MAVVTAHRSAYGLDVGADDGWWHKAACQETPDRFTDLAVGHAGAHQAQQAVHLCLQHCKVLEQCRREARAHPPTSVVQAGLLWTPFTGKEPKQPVDPGCGTHCIHLLGRSR